MNLQPQTKRELIEAMSQLAGTVIKDRITTAGNQQVLRERAEMEKELARARAEKDAQPELVKADDGGGQQDDPLDRALEGADQVERDLRELRQDTDCDFCQKAVDYLMERPVTEQRQGLQELREMKNLIEANPDKQEVRDLFQSFSVLDPNELV